jgi:hypothetical protein
MKRTLVLAAGLLLALSAGAGIASASVSAAELQDMLSSQMAQAGTTPDAVSCPGGLAPELGAAVTCAVTMGGETRGVTITVGSVDNGRVSLNMSLAQQ